MDSIDGVLPINLRRIRSCSHRGAYEKVFANSLASGEGGLIATT